MRNGLNKNNNGHSHYSGFEIAINPQDIKINGYCRVLEKQSTSGFQEVSQVEDPDGFVASNCIIQYDQHWCVEFIWKVSGPLACLLECGQWKPKLYFEAIGGHETHFSPEAVVEDLGISGHEYKVRIPIKPYTLKPYPYKLVCCLQYCFKNGSPGPIVGFEDKGIIKIFEDKRAKKYHTAGNTTSVVEATSDQ